MQLHQVKRKTKRKKSPRVGRGGKRGKTSGRGTKGQKARAGRKLRPEARDIIKKIPKKRGYGFSGVKPKPKVINLKDLEKNFSKGDEVNPNKLLEKGLIGRKDIKKGIKILSEGDVSKELTISGCLVSKTAKEKIEKSGGKVD